jgi:hypothetical protein
MYVQAKKDPNQEWFPTWYRLTEEEMGHIMEDWDDDWKIPSTETEQRNQRHNDPETKEISSREEGEEQEKGNGKGKKHKRQPTHGREEKRCRHRESNHTTQEKESCKGTNHSSPHRR